MKLSGRIGDGPAPGRVIGRLTDLGWGARLRRLLDEPDAEVSDDVVQAAVKVLASWDWATRPTAVMALDSDRHPLLISSLARELAELGRLTDLGMLQYAPERRPVTAANSAYRVAALDGSWLPPDPGADRRGRRPGAAGRRHDRHRVDADDGRPRRAGGGCARGAALRAGQHQLTSHFRPIGNSRAACAAKSSPVAGETTVCGPNQGVIP